MSKNNISSLLDIEGHKGQSGSTKQQSGVRKTTKGPKSGSTKSGPRAVSGRAASSSTGQTSKSAKPSAGQLRSDEAWLTLLEPTLEEPMSMTTQAAAEIVEKLGQTPYLKMTKLEKVEFNTAMQTLRQAREAKYNAAHPAREATEGRKTASASSTASGESNALLQKGGSGPSPSAKLGAATRLPPGQIPKNQLAPNRRIDYLAEVEATGRGLAALMMDEEFTQNDKLCLAALRNKRIKDTIPPNKRTPEQAKELKQAQSILLRQPTMEVTTETMPQPLPSAAPALLEQEPAKEKFSIDSLFDIDSLFEDDEPEEAPARKLNATDALLEEAFGPEPEGYSRWRIIRIKYDGHKTEKARRDFKTSYESFDPFDARYDLRYRFEREIGERESKGADLGNPNTRAELLQQAATWLETVERGPMTGQEAASGGIRLPKQKSGSGQGEKAAMSVAIAGEDDGGENEILALSPEKVSDEITEDAWNLAMAEALEVEESRPEELDYSPTYRAMLAEMRYALVSNQPPTLADNREDLLWRYVIAPDMDEKSVERRIVAHTKAKAYYHKHVLGTDNQALPGFDLNAYHYRIILAALAVGRCIEAYATHWRANGGTTDDMLLADCKQATIWYIEAHRVAAFPEPSYLDYRKIIARLGQHEGYILRPEDLTTS